MVLTAQVEEDPDLESDKQYVALVSEMRGGSPKATARDGSAGWSIVPGIGLPKASL